jgi:transcriptional regulator with XRE-family HTH domain
MNTEKNIREQIIKCMNDRHMSQIQLSILTGIHESTISRILSGKREIYYFEVCKIPTALGISTPALHCYPEQVAIIKKML